MNDEGKNLIFLISQPRSGSTLTQRILGSHPEIHTQSEPWALLLPLHAFKPENIHAAFDADLYTTALNGFIETVPGGKNAYTDAISKVYSSLYTAIAKNNSKRFFLDKTPRYYYIIEELKNYFPLAKFIFLWRNPAAVISSVINSWTKESWYRLAWHKDDLLVAPDQMISGIDLLGNDAFSLNYEDLISEPSQQMQLLCNYLGIEFIEKMIYYGKANTISWEFGDQKTISEKEGPDSNHADIWVSGLKSAQLWRVVKDYIELLGSDTISKMGYSQQTILEILDHNKPAGNIDQISLPLKSFLDNTRDAIIANKRMGKQIQQLNENVRLKNEIINQRSQQFQQKEKELKNVSTTLQQKEELIRKNYEQLKQKDELLGQRNDTIKQKEHLLTQVNELLARQTELVRQKEDLILLKDNSLQQQNELYALQQKEIQTKELLISQLSERLEKNDLRLKEQNDTIVSLKLDLQAHKLRIQQSLDDLNESEKQIQKMDELLLANSNALREKSKLLLDGEEQLQQRNELIKSIEQSYTFKLGKALLWPVKIILRK